MKIKNINSITQNKDIATVFVVSAAILMIPFLAIQLSDDWDWNLFDFIVIGILLIGTGFLVILASRKIKNINYRLTVIFALIGGLLLTWAELAVGIFGTPFAGS